MTTPTRLPSLSSAEVLVWTLALDVDDPAVARLDALLADGERARAARFATVAARRRFTVTRSALRLLLAHYAGGHASSLPLQQGPYGKPFLAGSPGLEFNLSHAGDLAMIAFAVQRAVGVDIESTAREPDTLAVARQVFSEGERHSLQAIPEAERLDAFTRIWTRKEAYVKALGAGLGYPTRSFTVSVRADEDDALLDDASAEGARAGWRVQAIAAPRGYHAALAAAGRNWIARPAGWLRPADLVG